MNVLCIVPIVGLAAALAAPADARDAFGEHAHRGDLGLHYPPSRDTGLHGRRGGGWSWRPDQLTYPYGGYSMTRFYYVCDDPPGYYPQVAVCYRRWREIPAYER